MAIILCGGVVLLSLCGGRLLVVMAFTLRSGSVSAVLTLGVFPPLINTDIYNTFALEVLRQPFTTVPVIEHTLQRFSTLYDLYTL
jgi:hypothetical protein